MTIRLNVNDLHALARQFRRSHQQISDLMHRLNRHLQVLLSSLTAAQTSAIDQAQTEMEHEIKGYLLTLDDLEHLLSHTEARMIKTDQMLAARLFQSGGHLTGYPPIMSLLASVRPSGSFRLTASLLSEPLVLMKQLTENGLSGLFFKDRAAPYFQFDDQGKKQLWSVRRLLSREVAGNLCLIAYGQIAGSPLSRTVFTFANVKAKAGISDVKTVRLPDSSYIPAANLGDLEREIDKKEALKASFLIVTMWHRPAQSGALRLLLLK
ncbi:WXG100 family type VII secretion target [Bacillus sp. FSL W8-0848]|uniref:WXG100 family type VII secretion target n=1 Tax=Bacillus sp. FSL W8-0848 TaxID=2954634 RepID=UPI0030F8A078